jgi:hypothetical protein
MHVEDGRADSVVVDDLHQHVRCADLRGGRIRKCEMFSEGLRIGRQPSILVVGLERLDALLPHLGDMVLKGSDSGRHPEH